MDKQQEAIMELNDVQAREATLLQRRQQVMFEVVSIKRAFGTNNAVAFGPRQDCVASSQENAIALYKKDNPDCAGEDLVGAWETVANVIYS